MLEKKSLLFVSFVVFSLIVITNGCSGSLSRSKAEELISKDKEFSEPVVRVCCQPDLEDRFNSDSTNLKFLRAMESLGYIDSNRKLTAKGKKALVNWNSKSELNDNGEEIFKVPILKKEIAEITGIVDRQGTGMFSGATFTWYWKPIGDIGEAMKLNLEDDIQDGAASFQKYDDGWRVQQINLPRVTLPNGIE